jgi:dephospho-CoA kinase
VSKWTGKYVIGLTGNIATGKSVVRKMLEHLGAYGIDADALAHRAIAKGAPGYQPIVETFGKWILDADGEISREKLGKLVFRDSDALAKLEEIVHPLVADAIDVLVHHAQQPVIVIEAIKLLETDLASACDTIWITYAPEDVQLARLMEKRGMSREEALERIQAQNPQVEKVSAAKVVIRNTGDFETLWKDVVAAWKEISSVSDTNPIILKKASEDDFSVQRGRPRDSKTIAALLQKLHGGTISSDDVMAAFGEKAFILLYLKQEAVGLAGWQVENLVARATDIYISPSISPEKALKIILEEIEKASKDLQCEASLLFIPKALMHTEPILKGLGYTRRTPESLEVQAWRDAALESMPGNTTLFFKQLRQDRVLRPI